MMEQAYRGLRMRNAYRTVGQPPKRKLTKKLIQEIGTLLLQQIRNSGGRWTATIDQVMQLHGEHNAHKKILYMHAIQRATRMYGIQSYNAGPKGKTFYIA